MSAGAVILSEEAAPFFLGPPSGPHVHEVEESLFVGYRLLEDSFVGVAGAADGCEQTGEMFGTACLDRDVDGCIA